MVTMVRLSVHGSKPRKKGRDGYLYADYLQLGPYHYRVSSTSRKVVEKSKIRGQLVWL